jgi:hypothetical protein
MYSRDSVYVPFTHCAYRSCILLDQAQVQAPRFHAADVYENSATNRTFLDHASALTTTSFFCASVSLPAHHRAPTLVTQPPQRWQQAWLASRLPLQGLCQVFQRQPEPGQQQVVVNAALWPAVLSVLASRLQCPHPLRHLRRTLRHHRRGVPAPWSGVRCRLGHWQLEVGDHSAENVYTHQCMSSMPQTHTWAQGQEPVPGPVARNSTCTCSRRTSTPWCILQPQSRT